MGPAILLHCLHNKARKGPIRMPWLFGRLAFSLPTLLHFFFIILSLGWPDRKSNRFIYHLFISCVSWLDCIRAVIKISCFLNFSQSNSSFSFCSLSTIMWSSKLVLLFLDRLCVQIFRILCSITKQEFYINCL